jgi:hypothetical protein
VIIRALREADEEVFTGFADVAAIDGAGLFYQCTFEK